MSQTPTRRALLAAGGTVASALVARKLVTPARADPALQPLSALRTIRPPASLPGVRFQDADGQALTLAHWAGHGLVLNVWATWCPPCVAEMPALDQLAARLAPLGIPVLPVSVDRGGADAVRAFYAANHIAHLPVLIDPDSAILAALSLPGIPTTFVLDRQGQARAVLEGSADWADPDAVARIRALAT